MQPGFRILEHPADLGIEASGSTLQEAFEHAAEGMMSVILDLSTVEPREIRTLEINADDPAQLLIRWLTEILYLYDGSRFVAKQFTIEFLSSLELTATVRGEKLSMSKHKMLLDVKAVTYHQIEVKGGEEGGYVRVFLDI